MQGSLLLSEMSIESTSNLPYRVSTITATGSLNEDCALKTDDPFIDLDLLYDNLKVVDREDKSEGIVYMEYGKKKSDTMSKGYCSKLGVQRRDRSEKSKRFDNQVTMVYKVNDEKFNNELNVKIFKNGIVQMTGIRYIDQGRIMIDKIIDMIQQALPSCPDIVRHANKLKNVNYKVQLINSDLNIGFKIKQDWLNRLISNDYDNECTFESCIYPGVKILYFYNTTNARKDGICRCQNYCGLLKTSAKKKQECCVNSNICRKITIAVFQSGKMIITGAQSYNQIDEAYEFITTVLKKHRREIEMVSLIPEAPKVKDQKIIYLNKKNIRVMGS